MSVGSRAIYTELSTCLQLSDWKQDIQVLNRTHVFNFTHTPPVEREGEGYSTETLMLNQNKMPAHDPNPRNRGCQPFVNLC